MRRLIIVGYMGSGKTTLGKWLAKKLKLEFIDLDWYIEARYHKTISELFAQRGEEGFRQIEKNMLHEVAEFENVIISAGGGTPCFFDNMQYMNRQAETIYLQATTETLLTHLNMGKSTRPLVAGKTEEELKEFIETSLAKRAAFYEQAHIIFEPGPLTNDELVETATNALIQKIRQNN
ncbi:MAG: shikimate kinase [Bacteroidaceae bacterium]|nr:shikimate kinase [Bacteroidaceae bacterium]